MNYFSGFCLMWTIGQNCNLILTNQNLTQQANTNVIKLWMTGTFDFDSKTISEFKDIEATGTILLAIITFQWSNFLFDGINNGFILIAVKTQAQGSSTSCPKGRKLFIIIGVTSFILIIILGSAIYLITSHILYGKNFGLYVLVCLYV